MRERAHTHTHAHTDPQLQNLIQLLIKERNYIRDKDKRRLIRGKDHQVGFQGARKIHLSGVTGSNIFVQIEN